MYEYLYITIFIVIACLIFDKYVLKTNLVQKKWKSLLFVNIAGMILLVIWDNIAIIRNHWWYSDHILIGLKIGYVPIESFILVMDFSLVSLIAWEYLKLNDKKITKRN